MLLASGVRQKLLSLLRAQGAAAPDDEEVGPARLAPCRLSCCNSKASQCFCHSYCYCPLLLLLLHCHCHCYCLRGCLPKFKRKFPSPPKKWKEQADSDDEWTSAESAALQHAVQQAPLSSKHSYICGFR